MLTASEIFEEYAKCLNSPIYAIETYLKTFDKTQEGFVPFKLFSRQKEIIFSYEKHRFNLITKPRQAGISTVTQAYCGIKIGFADPNNPETIVCIANKLTLAKKFLKGIKDYTNQLPRWVWGNEYYGSEEKEKKTIFIKDSQIEVELPNGSKIIAVATSEDALRGYTPTFLIFDEAAFIDRGADLYAAAVTSLGCLTKDSLILTENGLIELDELVIEKNKLGFTNLKKPFKVCDMGGNLTFATRTFVSEYGETYRIKTKLGIELEGSWKHPILIERGDEDVWVRMNELSIGDRPIINYNQNYFGNQNIFKHKYKNINIPFDLSTNLDFCFLLGIFLSGGGFIDNGVYFKTNNKKIDKILTNNNSLKFKKVSNEYYVSYSSELLKWLKEFGFTDDKIIPLRVLKMSKDVISSFLQGVFNVDKLSSIYKTIYHSESKKLVSTLQTILLNFGIISKIDTNSNVSLLSFQNDSITDNYYIDEIVNISMYENNTYDLHVPITNSFISNGIISHNTGGKCTLISCVTKDTYIYTDEGIKQVSNFVDESKGVNPSVGYRIPNYNVLGYKMSRQSDLFVNNGVQDTLKIKTYSSDLEGTHEHKLWAYSLKLNKFDWFKLSELEIGDSINIQYGLNLWGNNDSINFNYDFKDDEDRPKKIYDKIDTNLSYLIGVYIIKGSNFKLKNRFGDVTDNYIVLPRNSYLDKAITNAGFKYTIENKKTFKINSNYLCELLKHLGVTLNSDSINKVIPDRLLLMSSENIKALVRGIMDGGSYSDLLKSEIGLDSDSNKLLKQLRYILLNLGISTKLNKGLSIKYENIKKYNTIIGFNIEKKKEILKNIKHKKEFIFIPNGKLLIKSIVDKNNLLDKLSIYGLDKESLRFSKINKTHDLSVDVFKNFIEVFINEFKLNLDEYNIDKILLENGKWEKILTINPSTNETFDFSLPNDDNDFWCHSVLYNGILGHQTPNGYDPLYYKTYEQALRNENTYNILELKWYEDPRYNKDLKWIKGDEVIDETEFTIESMRKMISNNYKPTSSWYSNMCKNMNNDKKKIAQELDVSFLGSGGNVVDDEYILYHEKVNVTEPKFIDKTYFDGNSGMVWIWSEPIEGHEYILAADVSRGDGADYSVFTIVDFTDMEQVAEYQGKIPPDSFAEIINDYGLKYNALVVVDNIGVGHTTVSRLVEMKYPDIYHEEKGKNLKVPGFNINGVRLQLISNLEIAIRTNLIKIRSLRVIHELKTFIYKNGRPDHMDGYNDDCLKKGTLIKTIEGYKPIEDVKVGDLVLTHLGRYKEVEACLEKPFNGEWYDFKFQGMLNLGLSYNHPLYSAPDTWKDVNSDDYNKREWVLPNEWDKNKNGSIRKQTNRSKRQISIKENLPENNNTVLNYDDFRTKYPNEPNTGLNKITLDNNFAKFLGLFLADGYAPTIEKEYDGNKYYTMSIAFHVKDESLCVEMSEYLKSININSHRSKVKGNGFSLIFSSKFLSGILSHCYDNNREKILPYYAHNLGQDLKLVLEYWVKGDGCIDNKHGYDFIAASTSKQLALSMMDIAWSCGKYATISLHTRHRYGVKTKDQYWVNIRNEFKDGDRLKLLSDFEYGNKTVKINKTIYSGTVYNLQVKDDESFIANGIVVHNCLMTLGMGLWVLQSSFKSLKKANQLTKAILSAWSVGGSSDASTTTITTYDPKTNQKVTKINPNHRAYKNIQDPNGDYMWLFSGLK